MANRYFRIWTLVLFSTLTVTGLCRADQTAAQLPQLFEELQQASSGIEASRIEERIWQHWLEAPDAQAAQLMEKITSSMAASDLRVALQYSDQLVESHPQYAEAWNKRATIHYLLGDNAKSVADIRETIALEPRHFGAISGLGLIFLRQENLEAASDAFEQVLSISPASLSAQRSVELVQRESGKEI